MAKVEQVEKEERSEKEDEKREIEFHYAEGFFEIFKFFLSHRIFHNYGRSIQKYGLSDLNSTALTYRRGESGRFGRCRNVVGELVTVP